MNQQIRDFFDQNRALSTVLAGAVMVAAVGFFMVRMWAVISPPRETPTETLAYFYDQNTQTLFTMPAATEAPVETATGPYQGEPAGVRAHVFACGQCSDESARFIGWLDKPLPPDERPPLDDPSSEASLVRRVSDTQWVRSDSEEGEKIAAEAMSRCQEGKRINYCLPEAD